MTEASETVGIAAWPRRALVWLVRAYQAIISPLKPAPTCRFEPTCSSYAVEAIATHGALKGSWLAVVRVAKCGPWHPGGYDPVPPHTHHPEGHCASGTDAAPETTAVRRDSDSPHSVT